MAHGGGGVKIPRDAVSPAEWQALEHHTVVHVRAGEARFAVTGKGALLCLQGLVTCDLVKAPDRSRHYAALLTSKGMIVSPLWIERQTVERFVVEAPAGGGDALREILATSLPPRLCTWAETSSGTTGVGWYGAHLGDNAIGFPGAVRAVARGTPGLEGAPVSEAADALVGSLVRGGAVRASDALMESCRIFAGIPALGSEIDGKTLPQEVRGDELGAISYTKGCYLGQETVARVHFRGHPNRRLALLVLDAEPEQPPVDASRDGKVVGRLTSTAWSDELDAWAGQAVLRRDVADGATLEVGGTVAVVRVDRWLREP